MKIKNIPITILVLFLLSLFPSVSLADTATGAPTSLITADVLDLQTPEIPSLIAKIKEAKELLTPIKANYQLKPVYKGKKVVGYSLGLRDLFVAILDPTTGAITITGAMQNGKTFTFPDKNFDIKLVRFNGVNSRFQVNSPKGGQVIALKYLITPVESGSKSSIEGALYEALYTPYTPFLDQPEVIAYGSKYLDNLIADVSQHLHSYPSVSISGKTILEAINPSLIKALVLAEHTDSGELLKTTDPAGVINRVKVLFATNEGDTYRYSGSSAGALGISQFISSTYLGLVKRHPNANLINDFKLGMADHITSIKATYILLDDYIQSVQVRASAGFIPGQSFDYGVAAYNAGVVRIARAINSFGSNWNSDPETLLSVKQGDVSSLAATVEALRQKTLATKNSTEKTAFQKELAAMRITLADSKKELTNIESATLKDETRGYLQKIYNVISTINAEDQNKKSGLSLGN